MTAVTRVDQGQPVLSPSVTRRLIDRVASSDTGQPRGRALRHLKLLTEREREIAVAVGEGKSNAEISRTLYLSVPTVKVRQPHPPGGWVRAAQPARSRFRPVIVGRRDHCLRRASRDIGRPAGCRHCWSA